MNARTWQWHWQPAGSSLPAACITAHVLWRGLSLELACDGVAGLPGSASAHALPALPAPLRQAALQHLLQPLLLAWPELHLVQVQWHDTVPPGQAGLGFAFAAAGAPGVTQGTLHARGEGGQRRLLQALVAAGVPLPADLPAVQGHLHLASLALPAADLAALEPGDVVWLDAAVLEPRGLGVRFVADDAAVACAAWFRRSTLWRDDTPQAQLPAAGALQVRSAAQLQVPCAWPLGGGASLRLPVPALALRWAVCAGTHTLFEGRLLRVGRRLALDVLHVAAAAPQPQMETDDSHADPRPPLADPEPGADRHRAVPGHHAHLVRQAGGGVQPRAQRAGAAAGAAEHGDQRAGAGADVLCDGTGGQAGD